MSFIRKSIVVLLALITVTLLGGFLLPSQVHVERQALINASPEKIFTNVSDLSQWESWSPWANIDPDAEFKVKGKGVGQLMTWASDNPEVGSGSQQVTELSAPNKVKTHLDFGDMGVADATFTIAPAATSTGNESQGNKTLVTWSLDTDVREGVPLLGQPLSTYFGFFMDSMVGEMYEAGLANLKSVVEGSVVKG
ncbi:MAG: SRPBCC family protein [Cyanobacteria bacterium J06607_13]